MSMKYLSVAAGAWLSCNGTTQRRWQADQCGRRGPLRPGWCWRTDIPCSLLALGQLKGVGRLRSFNCTPTKKRTAAATNSAVAQKNERTGKSGNFIVSRLNSSKAWHLTKSHQNYNTPHTWKSRRRCRLLRVVAPTPWHATNENNKPMKCFKCGFELPSTAKFCRSCGSSQPVAPVQSDPVPQGTQTCLPRNAT